MPAETVSEGSRPTDKKGLAGDPTIPTRTLLTVAGISPFLPVMMDAEGPQGMLTPPTQVVEGLGAEVVKVGCSSTPPLTKQQPLTSLEEEVDEELLFNEVIGDVLHMVRE